MKTVIDIPNWTNVDDLLKQFLDRAKAFTPDTQSLEIERKWVVSNELIEHLQKAGEMKIETVQGYLSVEPEIRYRASKNTKTDQIAYYLAYKSNGDLVRTEVEYEVSQKMALKLAAAIRKQKLKEFRGNKFIEKEYWPITEGDHRYQISRVDKRRDFCYMEVEFMTEEEAKNFMVCDKFKPFILKEVTNDPSFKLKNYWARTRLR